MTINKIKKELISRLLKEEIAANVVKVKGFNKENKTIKTVIISLGSLDNGTNVLYSIKSVLDNLEEEFEVVIMSRMIEF